jgi:hypothetical protein
MLRLTLKIKIIRIEDRMPSQDDTFKYVVNNLHWEHALFLVFLGVDNVVSALKLKFKGLNSKLYSGHS